MGNLLQGMKDHRRWFACSLVVSILMMLGYEFTAYDLGRSADLPAYAANALYISDYTVIDREDVSCVTLFYLDRGDSAENLVIAFARSPLLARFDSDFQTYTVEKEKGAHINCRFSPGLSHAFTLTEAQNWPSPRSYIFSVINIYNRVTYSELINSHHRESFIFATLLFPHLLLFLLSGAVLSAVYVIRKEKK